jgi:hypothetical protein
VVTACMWGKTGPIGTPCLKGSNGRNSVQGPGTRARSKGPAGLPGLDDFRVDIRLAQRIGFRAWRNDSLIKPRNPPLDDLRGAKGTVVGGASVVTLASELRDP